MRLGSSSSTEGGNHSPSSVIGGMASQCWTGTFTGVARTQVFPERGVSRFPDLGMSVQVDEASSECHRHGLGAVGDAEFGENVLEMDLHGLVATHDRASHVLVGQPSGHQRQDLEFPFGEVATGGMLSEPNGNSRS